MNRCTSVTSCDNKMPSSFLRLCALGEFEVADPCLPVKLTRLFVVLVSVIEGAVVLRVNGHVTVIAPAILSVLGYASGILIGIARAINLATGTVKEMLFT